MTGVDWESPAALRVVIGAGSLLTVLPLLGWVWGLGSFALLFWLVSVPALACVIVSVLVAIRHYGDRSIADVASLCVFAGLVGTVGYDLFRVPFVFVLGFRLLSPIESYGVLLMGAGSSSGLTDLAGWSYHFLNGVGFALVYGMAAAGRRWWWGLSWAMVLETATIVTPFATAYGLRGATWPIAIAYAAHVPYGIALGVLLQDPKRNLRSLRALTAHPTELLVGALACFLLLWLGPWDREDVDGRDDREVAARIVQEQLVPEFVRVGEDGCASVANDDQAVRAVVVEGTRQVDLAPGEVGRVCAGRRGVLRVRTTMLPFDGGFIING